MSTQTLEQTEPLPDGMLADNQSDNDDNAPALDQSNVPDGKYRAKSGKLLFVTGNTLQGSREGISNLSTPWFDGKVTEETIKRLENLSKQQLFAILRKLGGIVGHLVMTDEEKDDALRAKFFKVGLNEDAVHKFMPAAKEWYDRTKGKPAQSIQMTVKDEGLDKLSTQKLLRLAAMLDEPVVIAPLPQKLID